MIVWDTENGKVEKVVICDVCGKECTEDHICISTDEKSGSFDMCTECAYMNFE